ncbi:hypothetical protein ACFX1X_037925 [Malus domestica]
MKYFCSGWVVCRGIPGNEEYSVTREGLLESHFREEEVLRGCAFAMEGEGRYLWDFSSQPELFPHSLSAADGWMNSTNYALSDKAARNFRKADSLLISGIGASSSEHRRL